MTYTSIDTWASHTAALIEVATWTVRVNCLRFQSPSLYYLWLHVVATRPGFFLEACVGGYIVASFHRGINTRGAFISQVSLVPRSMLWHVLAATTLFVLSAFLAGKGADYIFLLGCVSPAILVR